MRAALPICRVFQGFGADFVVVCGTVIGGVPDRFDVKLLRHVDGARDRLDAVMTWPHFAIMLVLVSNIFTIEVNEGSGHVAQFPWVLITHLQWLAN